MTGSTRGTGRTIAVWAVAAAAAAACGDDGAGGAIDASTDAPVDVAIDVAIDAPVDASEPAVDNPGFPMPTAVTKANTFTAGAWTEVGDADWSCLGTPSSDQASTQDLMLSGTVRDFQNNGGVASASITAFAGSMFGGNLGMATAGAGATRGQYSMTLQRLPAGVTRYGFKLEAASYLRTYVLGQYLAPAMANQTRDLAMVSNGTVTAVAAFVGETYDNTTATTIGTFRDCQGRAVSNAVATVSSSAGMVRHLANANTFYFSAQASSLPVRHNVAPVMNKDGLFVVIDLQPRATPAYVQIWGFRTAAELTAGTMTLLAELPAPMEASSLSSVTLQARRQ